MHRLALLVLVGFAPFAVAQETTKTATTVRYDVDCTRALEGTVRVTMKIDGNTQKALSLSIPVWAPGSYRIQNFQKNITEVTAAKGKVEPVDDKTWKIAPAAESVTVTYSVKVSKGNIGDTWYDCIGPATFLYVVGRKDAACSVAFQTPKDWKVSNGLELKDGVYSACDYDTFIDQPSMLGYFELLEFKEGGAQFQIAACAPVRDANDFGIAFKDGLTVNDMTAGGPAEKAGLKKGDVITKANGVDVASVKDLGKQGWTLFVEQKLDVELKRGDTIEKATLVLPPRVDGAKLAEVHQKLVRAPIKMFGGRAPFDRYVFLIYFKTQMGGGGLEHLFSCHIEFPLQAVRSNPSSIDSLESHEFFHAWNVKRIRPFELGPFDYSQKVPSKHLWLCEGVTSYYGDLGLARVKLWDESRYFLHLSRVIDSVRANPERLKRPIEDFCESAQWGDKPPTSYYYDFGEVLGLLLDLRIRALTKNEKSMDDVMRHLYKTYVEGPAKEGKGWIGVGFPRDGILKAINEVSGSDFKGFYEKYISGAEELPYEEVFKAAGLDFSAATKVNELAVSIGRQRKVDRVPAGSDAEKAGFKVGDVVTALGGEKVDAANYRDVLSKLEPGKEVKVTVDRGGESVELKSKVSTRERPGVSLKRSEKATDAQKKLVDSWLGRDEY